MGTRKKSRAIKDLEKIRKRPLTFGDLLYATRTTAEMTQLELATKSGTSKAKICDFEKGRRIPTLELAVRLAQALGHSEALFLSKIIAEQVNNTGLNFKVEIKAA
ncbi:MAG: helix-turn-helix transcriptional regulator [Bacteriovoracales bacterium]|nr:helix-turn-helix transcriptional regulator [Bacteriovoracales bacterium]